MLATEARMSYSYTAKIDLDANTEPKLAVEDAISQAVGDLQASGLNDVSKQEALDHQGSAIVTASQLGALVRGDGSLVSVSVSGHGSFVNGEAVQSSLNVSVSRAAD